jgi:hypothetical protein
MAKKKDKGIVGRKNTIITSIPKPLYENILTIQLELNTNRKRKKPYSRLEAALTMVKK